MDTELATDILEMNAVGVTAAMVAVLVFLIHHRKAFTRLQEILKMTPGNIDRTTLYRTLMVFCDAGLLYKLTDSKSMVFYGIGEKLRMHLDPGELTGAENYHFQCNNCDRIFCLPVKIPSIELPAGFTKTSTSLLLSGNCGTCGSGRNKKSC